MFLDLDMFLPDFFMNKVEDINIEKLKKLGFDSIILDLDNTLVGWRSRTMSDSVKKWIETAIESGFKLCIVSNCLLHGRVRFFGEMLGIPFVFRAIKPRKKSFMDALKILDSPPDRTVVIGDQVFTDVFGGNRMGFLTILVLPIDKKEFYATLIQRTAEKILLSGFRKKGVLKELCEESERPLIKTPKTNSSDEGKNRTLKKNQ